MPGHAFLAGVFGAVDAGQGFQRGGQGAVFGALLAGRRAADTVAGRLPALPPGQVLAQRAQLLLQPLQLLLQAAAQRRAVHRLQFLGEGGEGGAVLFRQGPGGLLGGPFQHGLCLFGGFGALRLLLFGVGLTRGEDGVHGTAETLLERPVTRRRQPGRGAPLLLQRLGLAGGATDIDGLFALVGGHALGEGGGALQQRLAGLLGLSPGLFQALIDFAQQRRKALLHVAGVGEAHRRVALPFLWRLPTDFPHRLPVRVLPVLGGDEIGQLPAQCLAAPQVFLALGVELGEVRAAGFIGAVGGGLEAVPERLVLILVGAHQRAPLFVQSLDGAGALFGVHVRFGERFHALTELFFLGLGGERVPVAQLFPAWRETLKLLLQPGIVLLGEDRLGFVPEPVGVLEIALL